TPADKRAIVLFGATGLPIIVAVTAIGRNEGLISSGIASALVGAGMLSVLLFPLLALRQQHRTPPARLRGPKKSRRKVARVDAPGEAPQ
ncbi:MAG TPA: hypothetical protein VF249_07930, partial [Arthrobacter sp.]